jgi:hypothetical protein
MTTSLSTKKKAAMKRYILSLLTVCSLFCLNACKETESQLEPSNINNTYSVPQGNTAFDQTIVDYYKKYDSYILYKFTEKDAYWTPTGWKKPIQLPAGSWQAGGEVAPAEEAFIPNQLELIQTKWFNFYSDKFLKKFLPTKILLCSKVDSITTGFIFGGPTVTYVKQTKKVGAYYNYDNIQVNYGDASINSMTAADTRLFIAKINLIFIQSIIARGLSNPTDEFINSADYVTSMTTIAQANGKGIIVGFSGATAQTDWEAYITAMVSYSTVNLNTSTVNTNSTPMGILNATKDVNGLIKKRYDMVRNYFIKQYNVDLQLIGNASKGI